MSDMIFNKQAKDQLLQTKHGKQTGSESHSRTFGIFPKLPPELRRLMWKWTLPDCQVHFIVFGQGKLGAKNIGVQHIKSPPLPVTLMVNQESRHVALESLDRFQQFPADYYSEGEERTYGYFNPKADYLHIPNRWRNADWNFAQADFPNISICVHREDNPLRGPDHFPRISNRDRGLAGATNLSEELIKIWRRKRAEGDLDPIMPNIVLVLIDKEFTHEDTCPHVWPTGEPPIILDHERPLHTSVPDSYAGSNFWEVKMNWKEDLFKEISTTLGAEPGKEKCLPKVYAGVMRLICGCPQVVEPLRNGPYRNYIRHLEGSSRDKSSEMKTRSRRIMERCGENYLAFAREHRSGPQRKRHAAD
ncbi:hypothetical protein F53441_4810 [Fusarium austroafricanum]|uniref:2EXR domain-containing protein n=1 Tax=Fusarium austroafricanum TaxID=2364996 RepID=A0A8H4P0C5_9HYPO|nr:hypothetical protein F53441_4810 [Fusarium austroafricanum]